MSISVFELFLIGIGPSSSHTVGPMRAASLFLTELLQRKLLDRTKRVKIDLYGSLALTGRGHGTDKAVLVGLTGAKPESVDPNQIPGTLEQIRGAQVPNLAGQHDIKFIEKTDLVFHYDQFLPQHANGLTFSAFDSEDKLSYSHTYYSIGGGFVLDDEGFKQQNSLDHSPEIQVKYPFKTAAEPMAHCQAQNGLS